MEFKYKDLVKVKGAPLEVFEIVAIRKYQDKVLYLIWGVNTDKLGSVTEQDIEKTKPYWGDAPLPFEDVTVPNVNKS